MSQQPQLISQAEYARRNGFSRQYVSKLIREGVIRSHGGQIDPDEADALLASRRNPAKPLQRKRRTPEPDADIAGDDEKNPRDLANELLRAKLKTEQERGRLSELQRRKREGELVEAEAVKAATEQRASEEKQALLNFPVRFAPDMAAELSVDEAQLRDTLARYIKIHLRERSTDRNA